MTNQTATAAAPTATPVYVPGNSTVHAGRQIGTYDSGTARYRKLCSRTTAAERHEPSPLNSDTPITCKRCLAKLDQLAARTAQAAREATPFETTNSPTEETTMSKPETTPKSETLTTERRAELAEQATREVAEAVAATETAKPKTETKPAFETTSNPTEETTMSNPTAPITEKPADEPRDPEFLAAVAEATAEPAKSTKPAVEPAKLVEQVAKATRLRGLAVEPRQNGSRHVITITDGAGKRILAYVDPLKRGTGFRVEVANYGGYKTATVEDIAAAAELVKGSERRQPKAAKKPAAKKPAAKKPAAKKPAAKKPAAKKSAAKKAAPKAKTAETR
jgi:hypothetical protein